ncbi:glycosyltransferase [Geojedonia litorea]|uniref:Glycosyltransferase n=1 Tax=Geojedonia litorea TaxID=1268269 RepID=A0ABV9N0W8_9FLAO
MRLPLTHTDVVGVTIAIVTYNGNSRLGPTLEHLAQQEGLDFNCELLVIDNASTDGTAEFVKAFWQQLKSPYPLQVVHEARPGTMYAREAAISSAQYRYLLFCDDDNWLSAHNAHTAFYYIRQDSGIAALGGKGIMTYEPGFEVPDWMCERYERSFGTGSQGVDDGDISQTKGSLYTAGALFDRVWLDQLYRRGFTSSLKGRDGKSLVAGEDTELTMALKLIGGRLHYSSQLEFRHYMPSGRMQWSYLKRLWFAFGQSNYVLEPYYKRGDTNTLFQYYKELVKTILRYSYHALKFAILDTKEGDQRLLNYEQFKGRLYALLFKRAQYHMTRRMVNALKTQNDV